MHSLDNMEENSPDIVSGLVKTPKANFKLGDTVVQPSRAKLLKSPHPASF